MKRTILFTLAVIAPFGALVTAHAQEQKPKPTRTVLHEGMAAERN